MQNVSREYKESMRGIGRNRGYIRATIGIINTRAQENAEIDEKRNNLLYFSNARAPFNGMPVERIYAMPEEGFSRVDGTMFFPPKKSSHGFTYYNNGAVSKDIRGSICISFGEEKYDIKGLSLDFSDCYPTDFTIENDVRMLTYSGNCNRYWSTEDSFDKTSFLRITPTKMVNGEGRLRIFRFSCGITNTFANEDIINYSDKEYVSPIAETLPSIDTTLTVNNLDLYYLPDNPNSAIAYMKQGQEVKIAFGYDVNGRGKIEWLPERTTYLKSWKADEREATFTSTDIFDNMAGTYYRGKYRPEGISLFDLATDVFDDAGIENYFIDTYLKGIIVKNPMPVVSHASALQIISNAGRCAISEDRYGRIHIQSSFIPDMIATANNQTEYSHVENILQNDIKDGYANASHGFSTVNGTLRFLPKNGNYLNTGYISDSIWIEDIDPSVKHRLAFRLGDNIKAFPIGGYWSGDIPVITISLESVYTAFGMGINFRNIAPKKFRIITYRNDAMIDYFEVNNPGLRYYTDNAFLEFDKMEIVFSVGSPNARIFVDNIIIGDATDYLLEREQIFTSPMATLQNKIKDITVIYSNFKESTEPVVLASEDIIVEEDMFEYTVYFQNAAYGLILCINCEDPEITAEIKECSSYYATIRFTGVTDAISVSYSISGYGYVIEEQKYSVNYNFEGEVKTWNNPLISTAEHAAELEEWIAAHLLGEVEYEIDWRGDPAVDANDLFHLETRVGTSTIRNYENSLTFNGAWHGKMKARKVVK